MRRILFPILLAWWMRRQDEEVVSLELHRMFLVLIPVVVCQLLSFEAFEYMLKVFRIQLAHKATFFVRHYTFCSKEYHSILLRNDMNVCSVVIHTNQLRAKLY